MKQLNLITHCGANRVERGQLETTITPHGTSSWCPIAHNDLVKLAIGALGTLNMRVVNEAHAITKDNARYFGMLQVANCQDTEDYSYVLGLRNSHDKKFPAGLAVGAGVFVCDNLSFSGEISIARRHTVNINRDLPLLVNRAIGQLSEKWNDQATRFEAYKRTELSEMQVHDLTIRALDAGACTAVQVPHIIKEWRAPRHAEFAESRTAWRLFNSFTEISKEGAGD